MRFHVPIDASVDATDACKNRWAALRPEVRKALRHRHRLAEAAVPERPADRRQSRKPDEPTLERAGGVEVAGEEARP